MTEAKKKILVANGYKVTDSADWLGLSKEEAQIVEMNFLQKNSLHPDFMIMQLNGGHASGKLITNSADWCSRK